MRAIQASASATVASRVFRPSDAGSEKKPLSLVNDMRSGSNDASSTEKRSR
jgi:hypothetical protein